MPQPFIHYAVIKDALQSNTTLWEEFGNYAGFGSFGPDLLYFGYGSVADIIHWQSSWDYYCIMLDEIKQHASYDSTLGGKLRTYALGWYSHVVTDCIFHPYVYRRTQDHWLTHEPDINYYKHKLFESQMDIFVQKVKGARELNPTQLWVQCPGIGADMLDADVAGLISHGMRQVYSVAIDREIPGGYQDLFERYTLNDARHPIHQTYNAYRTFIPQLYKGEYILYRIDRLIKNILMPDRLSSEEQSVYDETFAGVWFNSVKNKVLQASVMELYDMAVKANSQVVDATEKFLKSTFTSAKMYFCDNPTSYLQENWNLDTGLTMESNGNLQNRSENEYERFDYGIEMLLQNYTNLRHRFVEELIELLTRETGNSQHDPFPVLDGFPFAIDDKAMYKEKRDVDAGA